MPEEFHDAGEAYAGAEHESGIGITQLMRDDPSGDSRRSGDFVQRFADLTTFTSLINAQHSFRVRNKRPRLRRCGP